VTLFMHQALGEVLRTHAVPICRKFGSPPAKPAVPRIERVPWIDSF